MIMIMMVIC